MARMWSVLSVGLLAGAMVIPTTMPSSAAPHNDTGAAIAGGVLGFAAGAAAANGDYGPPPPPPRHLGWGAHVRMCQDHYGWRYDPDTDMVRMHGHFFRCDDWPGRPGFGPPPPPPQGYGPPPHHYGAPPPSDDDDQGVDSSDDN